VDSTPTTTHAVAEKPEQAKKPVQFVKAESKAIIDVAGVPIPTVSKELAYDHIFAWLKWAPAPSSPCARTLNRCFPGAMPGTAVLKRSSAILKERFDFRPDNTIYGQSICPDEINNEADDLAAQMANYWGEVFPMGGIGGAPFVGKTGFGAFSHHVPDDGNVLILFGPHIAISDVGELGKYLRSGQHSHSTACGAVMAAYDACVKGMVTDDFDMEDMQQSWLKQNVNEKYAQIKAADEPLLALIRVAYGLVRDKLLRIVNMNFGKGKLALLGGIQINMPKPYEDHFHPLLFQVIDQEKPAPVDLLGQLSFTPVCQDIDQE